MYRKALEYFDRHFGGPASAVVRAPGRVNLIGEHTDYNEGFVLPMAIDRGVWIALRPRPDRRVAARSVELGDGIDFSLDAPDRACGGWGRYLEAVAGALRQAGYAPQGWEGIVTGDLPIGAGLSSSAALELATARAFAMVSEWPWDALAMARVCQRAENEWVGVNCGIMDQIASAAGIAGHALLVDCRSLRVDPVPLPAGTAVVILDTGTRRGLIDSAYNDRRLRCEAAARVLGVASLRDVDASLLESAAGRMDGVTYRRVRHVITENGRVQEAAAALRRGDAKAVGLLMDASHRSLRDDFEVSSEALNAMVEIAQAREACLGARMTGAGFAGCAVAFVKAEEAVEFVGAVGVEYRALAGNEATAYISLPSDGASVEWQVPP